MKITKLNKTNEKVKTIDIESLTWRDKKNGNSYFSSIVTVNYGLKDQQEFKLDYQYGHRNQDFHEAISLLKEKGLLTDDSYFRGDGECIIVRHEQTPAKKREVKAFTA